MNKIYYFVLALFFVSSVSENLIANDRHFSYLYESTVMAKGSKEIEVWTTTRLGKQDGYFAALDNRIEFETGLSKRLQTSFYLNFGSITTDNGTGVNQTVLNFHGISSEWKYNITNPYTSSFGFAFYGELGLSTSEVELETKLIFDKKIKNTTLALNLVYEPEWELSPGETNLDHNVEGLFGLSYAFSSELSAGFEVRNHNIFSKGEGLEFSALFGGPVISYSQPSWWVTFTVFPQIVAFTGKTPGSNLNLGDHEKFESRLLFSFHL